MTSAVFPLKLAPKLRKRPRSNFSQSRRCPGDSDAVLKSVSINFLLQLQKDAEEIATPPQVLMEESLKLTEFEKLSVRKEVAA